MPVSLIRHGYCYDPLLCFVLVLLHFSLSLILRINIVWSLCSSSAARRMITFRPTHHLMTSWSHRAESGLALVSVWAQLLMKNADRFLLAPTAGRQAGRQGELASIGNGTHQLGIQLYHLPTKYLQLVPLNLSSRPCTSDMTKPQSQSQSAVCSCCRRRSCFVRCHHHRHHWAARVVPKINLPRQGTRSTTRREKDARLRAGAGGGSVIMTTQATRSRYKFYWRIYLHYF